MTEWNTDELVADEPSSAMLWRGFVRETVSPRTRLS